MIWRSVKFEETVQGFDTGAMLVSFLEPADELVSFELEGLWSASSDYRKALKGIDSLLVIHRLLGQALYISSQQLYT